MLFATAKLSKTIRKTSQWVKGVFKWNCYRCFLLMWGYMIIINWGFFSLMSRQVYLYNYYSPGGENGWKCCVCVLLVCESVWIYECVTVFVWGRECCVPACLVHVFVTVMCVVFASPIVGMQTVRRLTKFKLLSVLLLLLLLWLQLLPWTIRSQGGLQHFKIHI